MILEPPKIKSLTVSIVSPSISHEVMGPHAMILVFWMLSCKLTFSLSSFTFIKRLFSSSLSAIRVVSSAYLRLLILLPAILTPACASSRPAFLMMYSAYKLNNQDDNIQPWCNPFPIWNQSVVPCLVLKVASWPEYRFLRKQARYSGIPISFKNFPQFVVIHTVKALAQSIKQNYPKRWCCESAILNMSANLENSAVATGLEKVSFHSNPKERQCQRMLKLPHNCTHLTH